MNQHWSATALSPCFVVSVLLCCSGGLVAQSPEEITSTKKAVVPLAVEQPKHTVHPRVRLLPPLFERQEPAPPAKVLPLPPFSSQQLGPLDVELGLVPPAPKLLFRAESETQFRERLRMESLQRKIKLVFPADNHPGQAQTTFPARSLPPASATSVAGVVWHHPLYFEDPNTERYGWYLPYLQPALSTGTFYLDALVLPYRMVVRPPGSWECDEPWPAPGDAMTFLWPLWN